MFPERNDRAHEHRGSRPLTGELSSTLMRETGMSDMEQRAAIEDTGRRDFRKLLKPR